MDYILIFFFFIILLVLVIFGLPIGRTSFNDEINDIEKEVVSENFESNAAVAAVATAPSTFYEWRDMTQNNFSPEIYSENETINSEDLYNDNYKYLETGKEDNDCSKCNNIDKYILKSSVPPCPDLTNYILKSEIPSSPDMNNYILKSKIPVCPTGPNMSDYIPKSKIPVCPTGPNMSDYILKSNIPVCQTCPTCPTCPKEYTNITENPKFKEWLAEYEKIVEDKINKNYINKKKCSKEVEQAYKNGEMDTFKEIARRFRDRNFLDFLKKKLGQNINGAFEEEMAAGPNRGAPYQEEMATGPNRGAPYQEEMAAGLNEGSSYQEYKKEKNQKNQKNQKNNKNQQNQTSYNTTNMNNIYNKFNTNFDNNYTGVVKNNNYSDFADWNKSSLLLEEEYYKDIPNACNSF